MLSAMHRSQPRKIESLWGSVLQRIEAVKARAGDYAAITRLTDLIARAGAPTWAKRAQTESVTENDGVVVNDWRDAWDHAAADAKLASIDARDRLAVLARERDDSDKRCRKLFAELVRERTFYELDRRLSPSVKSALVEFVRALARIGKGTGKTAGQHRRCRSGSDGTLLRRSSMLDHAYLACGRAIARRDRRAWTSSLSTKHRNLMSQSCRHCYAARRSWWWAMIGKSAPQRRSSRKQKSRNFVIIISASCPFKNLLEPGESIYDLMRAVFPE